MFSLTWPASMQIYWNKRKCCIRKEFNSHRTSLGHQHGCHFIVLGHQCGQRDVMWKHSIQDLSFLNGFKINDKDKLILALIFRFGSKKLDKSLAVSLPGIKTLIKHQFPFVFSLWIINDLCILFTVSCGNINLSHPSKSLKLTAWSLLKFFFLNWPVNLHVN